MEEVQTEVTVNDLNKIAEEIRDLRLREAAAAQVKKEISGLLEIAENKAIAALEASGLTSFKSPHGTIGVSYRTSVKTPKTPEEKAAFYEYLRQQGLYDSMVSVNSQTLNSFYKEQLERAKEAGADDLVIPGITGVTINPILSFRSTQ